MPPNAPPSSREQAEAIIATNPFFDTFPATRKRTVELLIPLIERADRAEEYASLRDVSHEQLVVANCALTSDLTAARERIEELELERERAIRDATTLTNILNERSRERDALRAELDKLKAKGTSHWDLPEALAAECGWSRVAAGPPSYYVRRELDRLRAELAQAQKEAATVRRAYLHEKARADAAGAPTAYTYQGAASAEQVEARLQADLAAAKLEGARLLAALAERVASRDPILDTPSLAADLGALRELCDATQAALPDPNSGWKDRPQDARLKRALANVPAWLKGRGE